MRDRLGISHPLLLSPMAGISTPALAAAVTEAGGLGALGVGNLPVDAARRQIAEFRARSRGPVNVNVFCHAPAKADPLREEAWLTRLRPRFAEHGAEPPAALREIYTSFLVDDAMLAMLVAERPRVVSFHFGLPSAERIRALRDAGIVLLATATSLAEARIAVDAGVHAIVAQGWEAGGHRGIFDPDASDERLGTLALVRILVRSVAVPVIAAGGIMDGPGIAAVLKLGAEAAQLGTAFVACPESAAEPGHRAALLSSSATTTMTRAISGRPARGLVNRFAEIVPDDVPDYPIAYDAGKALHAAARNHGDPGYGAYWAGQGAPLARATPAADLVAELVATL